MGRGVSFLKSHPFWTLLIVWVVFSLLSSCYSCGEGTAAAA